MFVTNNAILLAPSGQRDNTITMEDIYNVFVPNQIQNQQTIVPNNTNNEIELIVENSMGNKEIYKVK